MSSSRFGSLVASVVALVLLSSPLACVEEDEGLTAEQVVAQHIEAIGGLDALNAVTTMKMSGTWIFVGSAVPMTIVKKRPEAFRFELMDSDGLAAVVQATDGVTAWQFATSPKAWLKVMDGLEAETFREEWADFHGPLIDYAAKGGSIELIGPENLDGVETYHIKLKLESGREQHYFFHAENFTLVRKIVTSYHRNPEGYDRVYYFEEFRKVGDILVPTYFEREDGGEHVWTYEIDEVELNEPVDDTVFALPEGIEPSDGVLASVPL